MLKVRRCLALIAAVVPCRSPHSAAQSTNGVEIVTIGQPLYPRATVPPKVPAILHLPPGSGRFPAVVIVHGTSAMDGRGAALAEQLRAAAIASVEIDKWIPRGLKGATNASARIDFDALPVVWGAWPTWLRCRRLTPGGSGLPPSWVTGHWRGSPSSVSSH